MSPSWWLSLFYVATFCLAVVFVVRSVMPRTYPSLNHKEPLRWYLPLGDLLAPEIDVDTLDLPASAAEAERLLNKKLARRYSESVELRVTTLVRQTDRGCSYAHFPVGLYNNCDQWVFDLRTDHDWLRFK